MKLISALILLTMVYGCAEDPADVSEAGGADLILAYGRIYTLDWDEPAADGTIMANAPHDASGWHPDAEAVVTKGGETNGFFDILKFKKMG